MRWRRAAAAAGEPQPTPWREKKINQEIKMSAKFTKPFRSVRACVLLPYPYRTYLPAIVRVMMDFMTATAEPAGNGATYLGIPFILF